MSLFIYQKDQQADLGYVCRDDNEAKAAVVVLRYIISPTFRRSQPWSRSKRMGERGRATIERGSDRAGVNIGQRWCDQTEGGC